MSQQKSSQQDVTVGSVRMSVERFLEIVPLFKPGGAAIMARGGVSIRMEDLEKAIMNNGHLLMKDAPPEALVEAVEKETERLDNLKIGRRVNEQGGMKDDANKPMMALLPFDALLLMAEAMSQPIRENRYPKDNWKKLAIADLESAMLRHYAQYRGGEHLDMKSKLPHTAHMAATAAMICSLTATITTPAPMASLEPITVGAEVVVYDRYRFAIPLRAKVLMFNETYDAVKVELLESNAVKYPVGETTWLDIMQIGRKDS